MMRFNASVWRGVLFLVVMVAVPMATQAQTGTLADASIVSWGNNTHGECNAPTGYGYSQIATMGYFTTAIRTDGSLVAWGWNPYGWVAPPSGNNFAQIAESGYGGLAILTDGSLTAWGHNDSGQCNVPSGNNYVQVAGGESHYLAIRSDGTMAAWGLNDNGQCNVPTGTTFSQVDAGNGHSIAVRTDGSLAAWGWTAYGICNVPSGNNFVQVAGGNFGNVALRSDGTIVAWGRNDYGQNNAPSGNNFTHVDAGDLYNVALRSDGSIVAWGWDTSGQVSGTPTSGFYFSVVAGADDISALRARDAYDSDLVVSGTGRSATLNRPITVAGNASIQTTMSVVNNPTMTVSGLITATDSGGINGAGTINGRIYGSGGSNIIASGTLTLGNSNALDGFRTGGYLTVGSNSVVLNSAGFSNLGCLTTLSGGTLTATNGVSISVGGNLSGAGNVNAKIAAGFGSTVAATGNLTLGNAASPVGFVSDGELYTNTNTVTLSDSNQAVLGSLTKLGSGGNSGTLNAANGFLVDYGKNLVGQGTVNSTNSLAKASIINGSVEGTGSGLNLTGYIKGVGTYSGNITFSGTYSPGLSPAAVYLENMDLVPTSVLVMEIGGIVSGSQYDVLNLSGSGKLDGTLEIDLLNGFTPSAGDSFDIINGTTNGTFDSLSLPALSPGLHWDTSALYSTGTITAVPEPSTLVLLGIAAISLIGFGWRRRRHQR